MGISLSRSVVEIVAHDQKSLVTKKRFISPGQNLGSLLNQWVSALDSHDIDKISIGLHNPIPDFNYQLASNTAFLTTAGFESWLEVNRHLPGLNSPFEKDYIFGVTERVSPAGEVITPLREEEIEFLISKLKLSEVENVAVGFLHSNKNPHNELEIKKRLSEAGLGVSISSSHESIKDEKVRFLETFLEAHHAPLIKDWVDKIQAHWPQINPETKIEYNKKPFLERVFEKVDLPSFIYAGVDQICWLKRNSQFGTEITPSPLSLLEQDFFEGLQFGENAVDLELGPMAFGRSTRVTLFDLLFESGHIENISGVEDKTQTKMLSRVRDAIQTYSKSLNLSRDNLSQNLLHQISQVWWSQIINKAQSEKIYIAGPLAKPMARILNMHLTNYKVETLDAYEFLSPLSLLESAK